MMIKNDLNRSFSHIYNFEICEILGPSHPILADSGTLLAPPSPRPSLLTAPEIFFQRSLREIGKRS